MNNFETFKYYSILYSIYLEGSDYSFWLDNVLKKVGNLVASVMSKMLVQPLYADSLHRLPHTW